MQQHQTFIGEITGLDIRPPQITERERFLNERLLDLAESLKRTGLKKSQFYELISEGRITPPVKVGRRSLWPESEIQQYIADLMAARTVH